MSTLQFSYAKAHLSEVFDRVAGSSRVYTIQNARHPGKEVALLSAEMLRGLMAEVEILRDPDLMRQLLSFRKAQKEGRLVEYKPKRRG